MSEPDVLMTGLVIGESPRWHDGRLWFANWGTGEIVAVDLDGNAEVVAKGPHGLGWSIDWLPDGRLVIGSAQEGVEGPPQWFVMGLDGSGRASLPQLKQAMEPIAWLP